MAGDGRIKPGGADFYISVTACQPHLIIAGDLLLAINNETLWRVTSSRARALSTFLAGKPRGVSLKHFISHNSLKVGQWIISALFVINSCTFTPFPGFTFNTGAQLAVYLSSPQLIAFTFTSGRQS